MSLYRQLWIGIVITMLLVFGAAFTINSLSSSRYLQQQLSIKNNDDASAIALSLSQQNLDIATLEIQLATLLDQGSYEAVEFVSNTGDVLFSRRQSFDREATPAWFRSLFPIKSIPGHADVSEGWTLLGTLSLKSHEAFAYQELWSNGERTLVALIIAIVLAGGVASLLLRIVLKPLNSVVAQAQAIGERRFISTPEPKTLELAQLTRSMNTLSNRVRDMLARESLRLGQELEPSSTDRQTGLLNLATLTERLAAKIQSEDAEAQGALALTRVQDLAALNREFGRTLIDNVLADIGKSLLNWGANEKSLSVARTAGAEFCVLGPGQVDAEILARALQIHIREVLERHELSPHIILPSACTTYQSSDRPAAVLDALNATLALAIDQENDAIRQADTGSERAMGASARAEHWRRLLALALGEGQLWLKTYPVLDASGELLFDEGMLRITNDDGTLSAGEFLPWVNRLQLNEELDRAALTLGLQNIESNRQPLCINLTAAGLEDDRLISWLTSLLSEHPDEASLLSANISESLAYSYPAGFRRLHQAFRRHGARLGISHMGFRVGDIGVLSELGADHYKIAGLFANGISANEGSKALMRTYAGIANSLGIPCIASAIELAADREAAIACGAAGVTGPLIVAT